MLKSVKSTLFFKELSRILQKKKKKKTKRQETKIIPDLFCSPPFHRSTVYNSISRDINTSCCNRVFPDVYKSMGKKRQSVTYSSDRENDVGKIFVLSLRLIRRAGKETSRRFKFCGPCRGGRNRGINLPSPYFLSQFLPPPYFSVVVWHHSFCSGGTCEFYLLHKKDCELHHKAVWQSSPQSVVKRI